MKSVGIKDLKNHLSSYLESVKNGETIIVLDRNHPVAEIKKLDKSKNLTEQYIKESILNNSIIPAKHHVFLKIPRSLSLKGEIRSNISLAWRTLYKEERE
jgi:prevent-host-death family protein